MSYKSKEPRYIDIDSNYIKDKFSEDVASLLSIISCIDQNLKPLNLLFMSKDEFVKLKTLQDNQYIYWLEIIERVFIVAITSLLRQKKWFEAILIGIMNKNSYLFASSLRGLIESSADSYDTLVKVPLTLSTVFNKIKLALNLQASDMNLVEDLENSLIHYTHAQKLESALRKTAPIEFQAKQAREYLEAIKHDNEHIITLYSHLCQISHPSAFSLSPYIVENEKGLILQNSPVDEDLIDIVLSNYKEEIVKTFIRPGMLALISLKLINMLDYSELKICENELEFLDSSGAMDECNDLINKS